MITLDGVAARRAPLALSRLTLSWGPGVHALVGVAADGGPLLLQLVAGRMRLRAGALTVLGASPSAAHVRRQLAWVALDAPLPDALRVHEVLALASTLRGEPPRDPVARLAALGVEALAPRRVSTLAPEEARAVLLAEALTSTAVRVLLLEEPLVRVDPRAAARVAERVRARGREGCAVLVATASSRDASDLADDHVLLRAGAVAARASSLDELAGFSPDGARIRVVASDPQALLAALAQEKDVEAVARREGLVVARGRSVAGLAAAVGRAVVASGVDVSEIRVEPPSLEEARAAAAGIASATFEAAQSRTRTALAAPPGVGP